MFSLLTSLVPSRYAFGMLVRDAAAFIEQITCQIDRLLKPNPNFGFDQYAIIRSNRVLPPTLPHNESS